MKKVLAAILCAAAAMSFSACGKIESSDGENSTIGGTNTQIPNPIVTCADMEEAQQQTGFDMTVPETVEDYKKEEIQTVSGDIIRVIYRTGEKQVVIGKAEGEGNISGDYTQYDIEEVKFEAGTEVTLSGKDDSVFVATWEQDGYTYAITTDSGLAEGSVLHLVEQVK